jgi:hypothetical protein
VYALNVLLAPANLAGVAKSIDQIVRGVHTPFARTPKIAGRTPATPLYHFATLGLIGFIAVAMVVNFSAGHTFQAVFSGANLVLLLAARPPISTGARCSTTFESCDASAIPHPPSVQRARNG